MVYLVGVDHRAQTGSGPDSADFKRHLEELVRGEGIQVVCEEHSLEAVSKYGHSVEDVVARSVAEAHRLPHVFCDPDSEERLVLGCPTDQELKTALGITTPWLSREDEQRFTAEKRKHFAPREQVWLNRLRPYWPAEILFVCGEEHLESFSRLLSGAGMPSQIVSRGWGKM